MEFRQWLEATTGLDKKGGPSASGRLGQSPFTHEKGMGFMPKILNPTYNLKPIDKFDSTARPVPLKYFKPKSKHEIEGIGYPQPISPLSGEDVGMIKFDKVKVKK